MSHLVDLVAEFRDVVVAEPVLSTTLRHESAFDGAVDGGEAAELQLIEQTAMASDVTSASAFGDVRQRVRSDFERTIDFMRAVHVERRRQPRRVRRGRPWLPPRVRTSVR